MSNLIMGVTQDAESEEAVKLVEQRADLGATWWLESSSPFRADRGYDDEWPVDEIKVK